MSFVRRLNPLISALLAFALLAAVWEGIRIGFHVDGSVFPSGRVIVERLWDLLATQQFWTDLTATLLRALGGFATASVLGVSLGVLVGRMGPFGGPIVALIDFFRSVPVTTLYPAFVLVVGLGNLSKVSMVVFACVFVIALNAAYGVSFSSPVRGQIARLYGAGPLFLFWQVTMVEALPQIFAGLRTALGLSLIVSVLVEMFMGAEFGVGQRVMEAYSIYNSGVMYAYILATGLIGYGLNVAFAAFERRVLHWVARV